MYKVARERGAEHRRCDGVSDIRRAQITLQGQDMS